MENNKKKNGFSYTYSAKEQAELKKIREKYAPKTETEDKMERLRQLDKSVTQKATVVSMIFGIIGTLILGFGMSLVMTEISEMLGSYENLATVIGAIIGVIGGTIAGVAYPIYNFVSRREREKVAPEVIRLADELLR